MRVGIDIVEAKRFQKMLKGNKSLDKVFTKYEQDHIAKITKQLPRMAGLYAAKEAVVKALGIGLFGGLLLDDIEIRHEDSGRPYLNVTPAVQQVFDKLGVASADISISHTDTVATAICVLTDK